MINGLLKRFAPMLKGLSKDQLRNVLHQVIDQYIDTIYNEVQKM